MGLKEEHMPNMKFKIVFSAPDEKSFHRGQTPKQVFDQVFSPPPLFFIPALMKTLDSPIPLKKIESGPDEKNPGIRIHAKL